MFKNYLNTAWRSLLKNKVSSLINICGLSVGLGMGIMVIMWALYEWSYDRFQKHLPHIYLVMANSEVNGQINTGAETPAPLSGEVLNTFPEIKQTARTSQPSEQLLRVGDKNSYEKGIYADPSFFGIMTFKIIAGDPQHALQQSGTVIITERTAKKLFGKENPIGKIIDHDNKHALSVAAVIADMPQNSINQFDVIFPFRDFERDNKEWIGRWDYYVIKNWILMQDGADHVVLDKKMNQLFHAKQTEKASLFTYPLADLRLYGQFKNGKAQGGRIYGVALLGITGLFVLLIACVNFMNLTIAKAQARSLEVGIRKVVGATQWQMIFQFLTETLVLTFLATVLGLSVAKIGLPYLSDVTKNNIPFDLFNRSIWLIIIPLMILTAVIAGGHPAFFLSKFKAIVSLKGNTLIKKNVRFPLRKVLVTFQFMVSIFLIVVSIVIFKQLEYSKSQPIGYQPQHLLRLTAYGKMAEGFDVLKRQLLQLPGIERVSAGHDNVLQFGGQATGIGWTGKTAEEDFPITLAGVQYDWIATIGAKLVEGRDFTEGYGRDSAACLINEAAVRKMGLQAPVLGKMVGDKEVIGVVSDFIYNNPNSTPAPMCISLGNQPMPNIFIRTVKNADLNKVIHEVERLVKKENPYYPFDYHLVSEEYENKFDELRDTGEMINMISIIAIIISCLGLYGLAAFVVEIRTKEIGIRKVLGAGVKQLWWSLSKDFLMPVGLAFLIIIPIAAFAMNALLSNWEKHAALSWWIFALSGLVVLTIALFTVSYQALKTARTNPVVSLATE